MDARTVERTARVYLSADEARCEPRLHCSMRTHCARYVAALPPQGGSMMDGTSDLCWSPSGCPHYLPAVDHVRKPYSGPERRAKTWPQDDSEW